MFMIIATSILAVQDSVVESIRDWRTPTQIQMQIDSIAATNAEVTKSVIGHSNQGVPIQCLEISKPSDIPVKDRPAILIVAGIDSNQLLGVEVATDLAKALLTTQEDTSALLEDHKVFIIPVANPDVMGQFFEPTQHERSTNAKPYDNDHDGRLDEDGPDDLNGDGYITMMRVFDKEKATHHKDINDSRLDVTPEDFQMQPAEYALYIEGIDDDGDGKFNEDGVGGVNINKNFMHGYQYHGTESGVWQLSESESKALVNFALEHPEIALVLTYGQHDTLSKTIKENGNDLAGAPKNIHQDDTKLYEKITELFDKHTPLKNTAQPDWGGSFVAWSYGQYGVPALSTPLWSRPNSLQEKENPNENDTIESSSTVDSTRAEQNRPGGGRFDRDAMIAEFDLDGSGELSGDERAAFRESMQERFGGSGRPGGRRGPGNTAGSKAETPGNSNLTPSSVGDIAQETLDELMQAAEAAGYPVTEETMAEITPEQVEQYAKMAGIQVQRVASAKKTTSNASGEMAWLEYNDNARDGSGFIEWEKFNHPQLGNVEIGGWVPYFKSVPPTNIIDERVQQQVAFLAELATKLPKVSISDPVVTELSSNIWEIKVPVTNNGWLPFGTAMAERNKRARPYIVRINIPNDRLVTGQKIRRIWSIDGSGKTNWFTWVVEANRGELIDITLHSEKYGGDITHVPMKDTHGGKQ